MNFLGLNLSYLSVDIHKIPEIPDYTIEFEYYNEIENNLEVKNETLDLNADLKLGYEFENDDAAWIMSCTFMIFTMQTGFGLIGQVRHQHLLSEKWSQGGAV